MINKKWLVGLGIVVVLLLGWWLISLIRSGLGGMFVAGIILWALASGGIWASTKMGLSWRTGQKWAIVWLAEHDAWWSPYRMRPAPGHIVMMTKGREPGGPFSMVLTGHIPYWHYHEGDRRFYKEDDSPIKSDWVKVIRRYRSGKVETVYDKGKKLFDKKFPNGTPKPQGIFAEAGVVEVGFLHRYYRRSRRWDAWDIKPNTSQYGVVRKETTDKDDHIFYFATTIVVDLETVPTSDNYPAQIKVIENILLIHPEKAEFVAGKWETQATAATRTRAREYIARKKVMELRDERDSDKKDDFIDHILFANEGDPTATTAATVRLLPEYGVIVQGPYYVDFDLESGDKEMTAAMKKQMIAKEDFKTAELQKKVTVVNAQAEAEKRKIEAEGSRDARKADAEGIKVEFAARMSVGSKGADLSMAEAIKSAAPKVVSFGSGGVVASVDVEDKENKDKEK